MDMCGNKKRSVMIADKRTSVCLEDSFWLSLHAIVQMERTTIEAFVKSVKKKNPENLSSGLRVAILEYFQRVAERSMERELIEDAPRLSRGLEADAQDHVRERVVAFWSVMQGRPHHVAK